MVNLSSLLSDMGESLYDSAGDEQTNALWGLLNGQRGFQPQGQGFQPQGQGLPPVAGGPTVLNPTVSQEIIDPNTIGVMGTRVQQDFGQDGMEPPPGMGNRAWIEEARAALSGAPERRGLFGTKGTLRNILGSLGDAFLVGSGAQPMYAPQREREQLSDAMTGITQGGQEAMNAIERMAQVDPEAAAKMYNQVVGQQAKAQEIQQAQLEAQAKAKETAIKTFGQFSGSASKETYDRIKPILQDIKARGGLGDEFVIPETYDEALLNSYRYGAMPAQQQVSTDLRAKTVAQGDERVRQGDERISENRRSNKAREQISRSKGGGRPANTTNAVEAAPLLRRIADGETLSSGEYEKLDRMGYTVNRGKGGRPNRPAPAPAPASNSGTGSGTGTGKMVLRNGKWERR